MYKKPRIYLSVLLVIITVLFSFVIKGQVGKASNVFSDKPDDVNLVLDTRNYDAIPKNFRKSSDTINTGTHKDLNIIGLDKLNISGSAQFSEFNLPLVIKGINTTLPTTVFDLRQESHGFINGLPVSWHNAKNNANIGLTKKQVLADEKSKLESIKLNTPITFYNHPGITIIPTKVFDEEQLVKSKSLSYVRIPVTDGKIPTDDMVDYFVKLVKAQPKNTWYHFHCKEGIGRTSTFMIMYDMMKNYKEVPADDIIKRQLLLANFSEDNIKSFYNPERTSFLENFYKYCKEYGDGFDIKWSDAKNKLKTMRSTVIPVAPLKNAVFNYTKNEKIPTCIYVISQNKMSSSERTMIASLQGVLNHRSSSQIYTLNASHPDYQIWLDDLKDNYKIPYKIISDPWELLGMFKEYVNGYVLYNNKTKVDPSINNACSLASLNDSIVVDESIQAKVIKNGITKMKGDCRNTDKRWAFNNLWNSGLNHSTVIQLTPGKDSELRDYAIMTKSLIFYEDDVYDVSLRDKVFSSMKSNSVCLGWGPDEFTNVSTASKYGVSIIPADWSYNLSVLSAFPSLPVTQNPSIDPTIEKNVHYVTFIMSDGDNQQWYLGSNYSSPKWYGSPSRGNFNLGWSISPSLYYLAPTVFNLYYKNASHGTASDYFVVSPSGNGYIYPSKFDKNSLNTYTKTLNDYMNKVDEKYIAIIDDSSFHDKKLWDKFTNKANINGLFYLDYHKHDSYEGEILWSNNKPLVSCRDLLWAGLESEDDLVKKINDRVNLGETDASKPSSYTFVYVHVWSKDMSNIETVVNKLNKNSKVRVVTPETFMKSIERNIAPL